ncbi:glycoside hydrolase family 2 TIM barrel-domain containing protein [Microbacterium sp. NPDC090225]|uniref:glycoside hydrolase family 2 TIM barrel-domain containing protein n=1 Tax=Microbacterium sp. NPDC090225 TaxID=3364207 RepID=UPI00381456F9
MRTKFNDGWSYRAKATAFQEIGGAADSEWSEVMLPHDAVLHTSRSADAPRGETTGYFHGGAFEYRRTLFVSESERGRLLALEFDGVHRQANVYVNGALVGQDAFGYSRFVVRIDPYVKFGADNEIRVDCRTHLDSRWYTGAGIYREVHLISKDPIHCAVDSLTVTTVDVDDEWATIEVSAAVTNLSSTTVTSRAEVTVTSPTGEDVATGVVPVTVLPQGQEAWRQVLVVPRPKRWSVDAPALYRARVDVSTGDHSDVTEAIFGIRTIQVDHVRGLRINGELVKLRGACIHHDNGPLGSAAFPDAEERKIRLLKNAGFNAIRSAHNPASTALLDACDKLGMLVMDEMFDIWTQAKSSFDYSFDFANWWERDIERLVAKDRNHPSVIFYSIGNEIPEAGDRFGARWGRTLAEKIRGLDSARLITNGINGFVAVLDMVLEGRRQSSGNEAPAAQGGVNGMMGAIGAMMNRIQTSQAVTERTEESFAVLDVAGMNYGVARYEMDRELFPNRVIVGTETWPGDIDANWQLVLENSHVLGDFTWTGFDYLGEAGAGVLRYKEAGADELRSSFATDFPGLTAFTGDLDITGDRRTVSFYRETVFGLRTSPYIAVERPYRHGQEIAAATPWSWSDTVASWSWAGSEGRTTGVEVYSDAEEIELILNDESVGRAQVGASRAFRADFEVEYQPGQLIAVAYSQGNETGRTSLTSGSPEIVLALRPEVANSAKELSFVWVQFEDEQGVVQVTADRLVALSLSGPGELQGFASGLHTTEEAFVDAHHTTYDGKALAVIRRTGPGELSLRAEADGVTPAEVLLHAN